MAGSAAISTVLQVVLEKLASPILQECGLMWGVDKELERLQSTLSTIHAVLEDAQEGRRPEDGAVKNWLDKLKEAAYDIEDIVDEFEVAPRRSRLETQEDQMMRKVCKLFSIPNLLLFRFRMGRKIKEIGERLDAIAGERSKFHLREGVEHRMMIQIPERQLTHSFVDESEVYGRESDREKIIDLLISKASHEDISIISIVGMGGLGKTTLAQMICSDERVVRHFEPRVWVCVSEHFDLRKLIKAIIESATRTKCDLFEMDLLQSCLRETLSRRRFLLVLDDVWNECQEEWCNFKSLLRHGLTGSKIIITTRSEKVALITSTLPPHHLRGLQENDCWVLFKSRAFGDQEIGEHQNLVEIGKEIVKKCGGVPLAAKTLGSLP